MRNARKSNSGDTSPPGSFVQRPRFLEASSVGSAARSRLRAGDDGRVQSVFDHAVNVSLAAGLVSLVPEVVERGPLNITLRLPDRSLKMSSLGIRVGDKMRVQPSSLQLGDGRNRVDVSLGSSETYSPTRKFPLPVLDERELAANVLVARESAALLGRNKGLGALISLLRPRIAAIAPPDHLNIFASAALPQLLRLERAFRSEREGEMADAVLHLLGLGPGLTPSSDDVLEGLLLLCVLYAENRMRAKSSIGMLAEMTAALARGRTTTLSEEYLKQAASGRGNESIVRLCAALLTEGKQSVKRETERVIAIGETSGTDVVLGVVLGALLCITDGRRSIFQAAGERAGGRRGE